MEENQEKPYDSSNYYRSIKRGVIGERYCISNQRISESD